MDILFTVNAHNNCLLKVIRHLVATAQLEDHVDDGSRLDAVVLEGVVIGELLAGVNEANLIYLDALLFLERLLHF